MMPGRIISGQAQTGVLENCGSLINNKSPGFDSSLLGSTGISCFAPISQIPSDNPPWKKMRGRWRKLRKRYREVSLDHNS